MNVGITLPLPRDRETIELLVPRIREVRQRMPLPFLLENNVYYFDIPACEMDEPTFLNRLCRESGCGLVLDLHNVHANARNHGFDAAAMLAELELAHVGEIHVAGGMELDGFYLDAHCDTIPDPVWSLLEWILPRCPNVGGVTFELFGSWFEDVGNARIRPTCAACERSGMPCSVSTRRLGPSASNSHDARSPSRRRWRG
jgi:uncharacterized protein (UPF0276 family)